MRKAHLTKENVLLFVKEKATWEYPESIECQMAFIGGSKFTISKLESIIIELKKQIDNVCDLKSPKLLNDEDVIKIFKAKDNTVEKYKRIAKEITLHHNNQSKKYKALKADAYAAFKERDYLRKKIEQLTSPEGIGD